VKFRRKSAGPGADEVETPEEAAPATPPVGPFDVDELPEDGVERVDLGSLLIAPEEDRELRLQVDETTGEVQSVMLASADGAVELRAFAAPRGGDLWSDVRPRIAADMAQHGGVATEREGRFGTELVCQLSVTRGDGTTGTQPSRIIGINGPRWMLRATLLGRPATDPDGSTAWEDTITRVAVRRGGAAMPVGDLLPVTLPANARRIEPPTAND
jgi:Protein of unknown function (DUF3710)